MRWLVRLYPRDWRRRYGAEMDAQLRLWRPGPREVLDLLAGAIDAHVNPQWSRRRRRGRRRLGARRLAAFAVLLGLRLAADRAVLPAAAGLAHTGDRGLAIGLTAGAAEVALLGAVVALMLGRAGWRWPAALALGCALELVLGGGGLSPSALLPGFLEPLRAAAWAALLTWLATRPRRPGPWREPPEGAPVPARPVPDPPEPLAARARRSG